MANTDADMSIVFESFTDDDFKVLKHDLEDYKNSRFLKLFQSVRSILTPEDLLKARIVITASFIDSVDSRQNKTEQEYTVTRGSGVVVGKTMPPNNEGVVDILFPFQLLTLLDADADMAELESRIEHVGTHEAVHAHLYLLDTKPFDVYLREELGEATRIFTSMASNLAEEHLAEYIATSKNSRNNWTDAKSISDALAVLEDTLMAKLPAIPEDAKDYHGQAMTITFSTFCVLWKALVFLAAELRTGDTFDVVPKEITDLDMWDSYVAHSWDGYIQLLGEIPMSLDVDIVQTDKVVEKLAKHLQEWALRLGFDFHDTPDGQGWFQAVPQLQR